MSTEGEVGFGRFSPSGALGVGRVSGFFVALEIAGKEYTDHEEDAGQNDQHTAFGPQCVSPDCRHGTQKQEKQGEVGKVSKETHGGCAHTTKIDRSSCQRHFPSAQCPLRVVSSHPVRAGQRTFTC